MSGQAGEMAGSPRPKKQQEPSSTTPNTMCTNPCDLLLRRTLRHLLQPACSQVIYRSGCARVAVSTPGFRFGVARVWHAVGRGHGPAQPLILSFPSGGAAVTAGRSFKSGG